LEPHVDSQLLGGSQDLNLALGGGEAYK